MTDEQKAFIILSGWVLGHSWHCIEYSMENWGRMALIASKLSDSEMDYSQTVKHYAIHICCVKTCLKFLKIEERQFKSGISHGYCENCKTKLEGEMTNNKVFKSIN